MAFLCVAESWKIWWPSPQEVAELVLTVMLQQGHKTPTHMAKILAGVHLL